MLLTISHSLLTLYGNKPFLNTGPRLLAAQVQKPAPEFSGTAVVDSGFKQISLADYKGKYLVLFFYPLDLYVLSLFFQIKKKYWNNRSFSFQHFCVSN